MNYDEKYTNILKDIILSLVDTEKVMVFLFGSRASGGHTSRSDADIGLLSDDKLPHDLFHKIRNAIDESIIPWKVDVVDFTKVSPSFKDEALKDIVIWNTPKTMKKDSFH
ncbi:MAG: nucleotidyltransferase domain-containing protein [Proteobacteria bacterium]|nr:nucleotidyltransferase domain-containing protein [Pseudomonadota bacterium]